MAEWMIVEFAPASKRFSREVVKGFISAVIGKTDSVRVVEKRQPISLDTLLNEMYDNGKGDSAQVLIEGQRYWLVLCLYPVNDDKVNARLLIDRRSFNEEGKEQSRDVKDFIQRCIKAYNFLRPPYGRGDWEGIFDQQSVEGWKAFPESVADKRNLRHIFWLNFYSPEIVRTVGVEKFRTIPYGRLEELADGGVLLIRGQHPNECSESRYEEAIKHHLFSK